MGVLGNKKYTGCFKVTVQMLTGDSSCWKDEFEEDFEISRTFF